MALPLGFGATGFALGVAGTALGSTSLAIATDNKSRIQTLEDSSDNAAVTSAPPPTGERVASKLVNDKGQVKNIEIIGATVDDSNENVVVFEVSGPKNTTGTEGDALVNESSNTVKKLKFIGSTVVNTDTELTVTTAGSTITNAPEAGVELMRASNILARLQVTGAGARGVAATGQAVVAVDSATATHFLTVSTDDSASSQFTGMALVAAIAGGSTAIVDCKRTTNAGGAANFTLAAGTKVTWYLNTMELSVLAMEGAASSLKITGFSRATGSHGSWSCAAATNFDVWQLDDMRFVASGELSNITNMTMRNVTHERVGAVGFTDVTNLVLDNLVSTATGTMSITNCTNVTLRNCSFASIGSLVFDGCANINIDNCQVSGNVTARDTTESVKINNSIANGGLVIDRTTTGAFTTLITVTNVRTQALTAELLSTSMVSNIHCTAAVTLTASSSTINIDWVTAAAGGLSVVANTALVSTTVLTCSDCHINANTNCGNNGISLSGCTIGGLLTHGSNSTLTTSAIGSWTITDTAVVNNVRMTDCVVAGTSNINSRIMSSSVHSSRFGGDLTMVGGAAQFTLTSNFINGAFTFANADNILTTGIRITENSMTGNISLFGNSTTGVPFEPTHFTFANNHCGSDVTMFSIGKSNGVVSTIGADFVLSDNSIDGNLTITPFATSAPLICENNNLSVGNFTWGKSENGSEATLGVINGNQCVNFELGCSVTDLKMYDNVMSGTLSTISGGAFDLADLTFVNNTFTSFTIVAANKESVPGTTIFNLRLINNAGGAYSVSHDTMSTISQLMCRVFVVGNRSTAGMSFMQGSYAGFHEIVVHDNRCVGDLNVYYNEIVESAQITNNSTDASMQMVYEEIAVSPPPTPGIQNLTYTDNRSEVIHSITGPRLVFSNVSNNISDSNFTMTVAGPINGCRFVGNVVTNGPMSFTGTGLAMTNCIVTNNIVNTNLTASPAQTATNNIVVNNIAATITGFADASVNNVAPPTNAAEVQALFTKTYA
jgi:hypothetical protein